MGLDHVPPSLLGLRGGNLTGSATFAFDLPDKKLDLFKQMVPRLRRVLVLRDPDDPLTPLMLTKLRKAGAALQLQLVEHVVTDQAGIERVFGSLQPGDMDGVYVLSPNLQVKFSSLLIHLTVEVSSRCGGLSPPTPDAFEAIPLRNILQLIDLSQASSLWKALPFWQAISLSIGSRSMADLRFRIVAVDIETPCRIAFHPKW